MRTATLTLALLCAACSTDTNQPAHGSLALFNASEGVVYVAMTATSLETDETHEWQFEPLPYGEIYEAPSIPQGVYAVTLHQQNGAVLEREVALNGAGALVTG